MFRMLRGRWFWGLAGVMATMYLLRRSRRNPVEAMRYNPDAFSTDDVLRMGRAAVDTAVRAGRTIAGSTARAMMRQR